ncbi:formate dehydrogenase accessory protein FdhE [uncultured Desulfobacter sp.]|uniref:formate dehydrogenase accessory protein FdhE n=1 Tax=uncultured Desulfobacter sp. TaxID=240139 RepID=UPI0029F48CA3|nr:formate dehydrogenase accessory protein FdhE [uncultured Desulfobacter sp.]
METLSQTRIILSTMERLNSRAHLPADLSALLGKTALLQAKNTGVLELDLSGIPLSQVPVCSPLDFSLDIKNFEALIARIMEAILEARDIMPPSVVNAVVQIQGVVEKKELSLEQAWNEIRIRFAGDDFSGTVLKTWEAQTPEAPSALPFLVMAAAAPSLQAVGRALAEAKGIDPEQIHTSGACPVCGSPPYMLELRGKEGQRFAHCSFCRFTYRIRRVACACCNIDKADQLTGFTAEGEPGFRVETCAECNTYIKTIDFRELDREAFAPLNDLESLPLDMLAANHGYTRMALSVWCI